MARLLHCEISRFFLLEVLVVEYEKEYDWNIITDETDPERLKEFWEILLEYQIWPSEIPGASQKVCSRENNQYAEQSHNLSPEDSTRSSDTVFVYLCMTCTEFLYLGAFHAQPIDQEDDSDYEQEWLGVEEPFDPRIPLSNHFFHLMAWMRVIDLHLNRVGNNA